MWRRNCGFTVLLILSSQPVIKFSDIKLLLDDLNWNGSLGNIFLEPYCIKFYLFLKLKLTFSVNWFQIPDAGRKETFNKVDRPFKKYVHYILKLVSFPWIVVLKGNNKKKIQNDSRFISRYKKKYIYFFIPSFSIKIVCNPI